MYGTRRYLFLCILLFPILFKAQNKSSHQQQKKIDSIIDNFNRRYDSPKPFYNLLESSKGLNYTYGQSRASNFLSIYYRKQDQFDSAFFYIKKAIDLAKEDNNELELYSHYLAKGNIYLEMRQFNNALDWYQKVYSYSKKKDHEKFIRMAKVSMLNIARVYSNLGEYNLADTYYKDIIDKYDFDTTNAGFANIYRSIALNYQREGKMSDAISWVEKAMNITKKYDHRRLHNVLLVDLCDFLLQEEKFIEAKKAYDQVDTGFTQWNKDFYLGKIFVGLRKIDEAQIQFLKAFNTTEDPIVKKEASFELSELYLERKNIEKGISFREYYYSISDSLDKIKNRDIIQNNETLYKLVEEELTTKKLKAENDLLQVQNRQQRYFVLGLIIVAMIGTFSIILLIRNIKSKKSINLLKEQEKILLKEKVRLRENELNTLAIALSERQNVLSEINSDIGNINNSEDVFNQLQKKIKDLVSSGTHLSMITDRIESQYPNAVLKLKAKCSELSDTEIKYCLLTKLNLSLKETANILGVTANTVKTSRSRIKKKMEISPNISLKKYLEDVLQA